MTRLGIDASNLRLGGGITHLGELLGAADPRASGFERVIVWSGKETLAQLPERPWLEKAGSALLDGGQGSRLLWRHTVLPPQLKHCDLLFVPGGSYTGTFRPFVTMARNMLPFDAVARRRYGLSRMRLRLALLTRIQRRTFQRAAGVIFLTDVARRHIEATTGPLAAATVIPHGVSCKFLREPPDQKPLSAYAMDHPFRWLYVSIVDVYKHQGTVAEAVARLRGRDLPVSLDLAGPAYAPALAKLRAVLERVDPSGRFIRYLGATPHARLAALYRSADGFVFASSCENLPNILVEAMAAGLPIACSDRGVMPEILGDAGIYFDPEDVSSIDRALVRLLESPALRARCADLAHRRASRYDWTRCARDTFEFLRLAVTGHRSRRIVTPA